ncbi:MAG: lysylphosphatidylglycerol synthase transmembrane domain-containing protein [Betaproteobacteria bacterium]
MRSHVRTLLLLAAAAALLGLFLRNVDLGAVGTDIRLARPGWLVFALATMFLTLAIRALRWQYLLEPLAAVGLANAFRATAVGFAANTLLPARAGEVIRPYFLARHEPLSAAGAFATIVLERLLDTVTVLILLASFVVFFGAGVERSNPAMFSALKWAGVLAGLAAFGVLGVLFALAGDPTRLGGVLARLESWLPARAARALAAAAEKFAAGLGAIRRPRRLAVAILWSFPLWLTIASGIWAVSMAFGLDMPFVGSIPMLALLVVGVAVPTPGAIGGFHEAFRLGATAFYGAPDDVAVGAAVVLHALSIGPSLLLGLTFAAQDGLNLAGVRRLAGSASGEPAA